MTEILREPTDAELNVSNAIAAISEAIATLRQYRQRTKAGYIDPWEHQIRKLKMAEGLCRNVRHRITTDQQFDALRPKRKREQK